MAMEVTREAANVAADWPVVFATLALVPLPKRLLLEDIVGGQIVVIRERVGKKELGVGLKGTGVS